MREAIISEKAPAKINLYLHVTGKRTDGYHTLDSLVVFADRGDAASDHVTIQAAATCQLCITGPYATALSREDTASNLITKALHHLGRLLGKTPNFAVTLEKHLPLASGIGGGSADAAAALRGAAKLWALAPDHPALLQAAKETGADVPACLFSKPCYFGGIGDVLAFVHGLPEFSMLLVNPHIPLPTASVFAARQGGFTPAARFIAMPAHVESLAAMLAERRNDLEEPAIALCGAVGEVLQCLREQPGCLLARLSGSGATCFGLFATPMQTSQAATRIIRQMREWWVAIT